MNIPPSEKALNKIHGIKSKGLLYDPARWYLERNPQYDLDTKDDWVQGRGQYNNPALDAGLEELLTDQSINHLDEPTAAHTSWKSSRFGKIAMGLGAGALIAAGALFGGYLYKKISGDNVPGPIVVYDELQSSRSTDAIQMTHDNNSGHPYVWGDELVWMQISGVNSIDYLNMTTGQQAVLSNSGVHPQISEDYIIWGSSTFNGFTVYEKSTDQETFISTPHKINPEKINLDSNKLVFIEEEESFQGDSRVVVYDLPNETTTYLTDFCGYEEGEYSTPRGCDGTPRIAGDKISWLHYNITTDKRETLVRDLSDGSEIILDYPGGKHDLTHPGKGYHLTPTGLILSGQSAHNDEPDYNDNFDYYAKQIVRYNFETGNEEIFATSSEVWSIDADDNKVAFVAGQFGRDIRVYDLPTNSEELIFTNPEGPFFGLDGVVINNDLVTWYGGQEAYQNNVYLYDLIGQILPPLSVSDIHIAEQTLLNYDPNKPAKFVMDAFVGSGEAPFEFDYIKSEVVVELDQPRPIYSASLTLQTEGSSQLETVEIDPQYLNATVRASVHSTGRLYLESFIEGLVTSGSVGGAAIEATAMGSLKAATTEWQDVSIVEVEINRVNYDIPDHKLSSIVNDPNIWTTPTEGFVVESPVDIYVYKDGQLINDASNVVYSKDTHPEYAVIFNPSGEYEAKLIGTDDGSYNFHHHELNGLDVTYSFSHKDVPISLGEEHTYNNLERTLTTPDGIITDSGTNQNSSPSSDGGSFLWLAVPALVGTGAGVGYVITKKKKESSEEE